MNYWWTSDYHFSHFNIIRYCKRPFETAEEMNETIIRKHNERIKSEDTVFFSPTLVLRTGLLPRCTVSLAVLLKLWVGNGR
ncbi:MAG: hypothetical protein L6404_08205 [Candidatus Omnitrophica bacterium]|nr:hypothetical protein [Candidatus Omnitrophota bacterium]